MRAIKIGSVNGRGERNWEDCLMVFLGIGTFFILGWLLSNAGYGIDFSDEGYYLVWMSRPFSYDWSTTQFGFIYHPLYILLNGDISSLRQANMLMIFLLAWFLIIILLRKSNNAALQSGFHQVLLAAGLAVTSLCYFSLWIPTPSYNSLGFQAMLIVSAGTLLSDMDRRFSSFMGWVLIGFGGWLAFMAKPPLAVALGGSVLAYIVLSRKFTLTLMLLSLGVAISLFIASAIAIDGSIAGFFTRLKVGVDFSNIVGAGYTLKQIFRVDRFSLGAKEVYGLLIFFVFSFVSAYFVCFSRPLLRLVSILFSGVALFFCIVVIFGFSELNLGGGAFQGLVIWAIPFGLAAFYMAFYFRDRLSVGGAQLSLSSFFLVLPHVFAFGTNGNYWQVGSYVGIFWVLAGVAFVSGNITSKKVRMGLFSVALVAQLITVLLLKSGMENPYRQMEPLGMNNTSVEIRHPGSVLLLSDGYATYINNAVVSARKAGFTLDTPIIDLTGQSPTLLYALGAESIGYPWIAGGYPGSMEVARLGLQRVPCEKLVSAWVLLEPGGPRALTEGLLTDFGADLYEDYEIVSTWLTAEGAGGYKTSRNQRLLKPLRSGIAAIKACEVLREGK